MHAAVVANVLGARDRGLDPGWPPVLVVLVLVVLGAVVVSAVVVFRGLRAEARGPREGRSRSGRRKAGAPR